MLALGGFRIGTLVKLQYRHVKRDLQKMRTPIYIHVEAEITKGKYHDYDTFLGQDASEYLRTYLELRSRGSPTARGGINFVEFNSDFCCLFFFHTISFFVEKILWKLLH
jgi:hypothetical protein